MIVSVVMLNGRSTQATNRTRVVVLTADGAFEQSVQHNARLGTFEIKRD